MNELTRRLQRDAASAQFHCRLLRRLAAAVERGERFWVDGWRRALRTRGYDDVVC